MNKRAVFQKRWNGKTLEDWGACVSKEYKTFQNGLKRCLKEMIENMGGKLVSFTAGHYWESAMFERDGKYAYFNRSEMFVRTKIDLVSRTNLLIRTASHATDWTGGNNQYTSWKRLANAIDKLLGGNGDVEDTTDLKVKEW